MMARSTSKTAASKAAATDEASGADQATGADETSTETPNETPAGDAGEAGGDQTNTEDGTGDGDDTSDLTDAELAAKAEQDELDAQQAAYGVAVNDVDPTIPSGGTVVVTADTQDAGAPTDQIGVGDTTNGPIGAPDGSSTDAEVAAGDDGRVPAAETRLDLTGAPMAADGVTPTGQPDTGAGDGPGVTDPILDAVVVTTSDEIGGDLYDTTDEATFVTLNKDVVEEFYYPATKRPSHRILFRSGQVVAKSLLDELNAKVEDTKAVAGDDEVRIEDYVDPSTLAYHEARRVSARAASKG